jgi:hypothetical protein
VRAVDVDRAPTDVVVVLTWKGRPQDCRAANVIGPRVRVLRAIQVEVNPHLRRAHGADFGVGAVRVKSHSQ